jgi:hypothetical protein
MKMKTSKIKMSIENAKNNSDKNKVAVKDLTNSVVSFLNNNEKFIKQFIEKVDEKKSPIEQLAGLIVSLITNDKLEKDGKGLSLHSVIKTALGLKAKKAVAKKAGAKKPEAKKVVAKKAVAKKPVAKKAVAKKAVAKKPEAKKVVAKKAVVKKPEAKKVVAKKAVAKKPVAKKAMVKKPEVKKVVAKKAVAKKVMAKKPVVKKSEVKKIMVKANEVSSLPH